MFAKNLGTLQEEGSQRLKASRALLVGLGGLGGFVANGLVRLGVGKIYLVDADRFEESNLNRQLFSSRTTLGKPKTDIVKQELSQINPSCVIESRHQRVEDLVEKDFPDDVDIIIDAVDNVPTKRYLETLAEAQGKPLLHGAIGGWYGQVGIIMPKARLLAKVYAEKESGVEKEMGNPTFTPAVIGNLMVLEYAKYITGNENALIDRLLFIDLEEHTYRILIERN